MYTANEELNVFPSMICCDSDDDGYDDGDGGMPDDTNWDPDGIPEGCEVPVEN